VQKRLDKNPRAMRMRRETAEHPFGTMKGAHGRNSLPDEDASQGRHRDGVVVLTYNLTRILNIVAVPALLEAIKG
jgi:hypothetical protein